MTSATPAKLLLARLFDFSHPLRRQKTKVLAIMLALSMFFNVASFLRSESASPTTTDDLAWISQLAEQPSHVQLDAVPMLALLATSEPIAMDRLDSLLDVTDPQVRLRTLRALAYLGVAASSSRERIRSLSTDPNQSVREAANSTIRFVDGHSPPLPISALIAY